MTTHDTAARRVAVEIYKAADKAIGIYYDPHADVASKIDLEISAHILRAVLETLTTEQRAAILAKVTR
jgi:predicted SpoU family rRNA methylase